MNFKRIFLFCLLLVHCCVTYAQQSQRYSRFQYHHRKWLAFHTPAFHLYFPVGYDSLCATVAREVPGAIKLIEKRMSAAQHSVPNIIVYPSADQLYESNIGSFEPTDATFPTFITRAIVFFLLTQETTAF